jgi:capsular polysaccharide biosynthesis protein
VEVGTTIISLIEEMPRVWLASQAGFKIEDFDHLIMFSPIHDWQKVVCERLGIDSAQIIPLEKTSQTECKKLYFTTLPWNYGQSFVLMARDFLDELSPHSNRIEKCRIYVSRKRCTHGRITNEQDLWKKLAGAGFEKVVLELLPFDEQVALFRRAECVIGAGLSNIIFSPLVAEFSAYQPPEGASWKVLDFQISS